jgi:hypothetical protein
MRHGSPTVLRMIAAAGAVSPLLQRSSRAAEPPPKASNVVLLHGVFADGSSWSKVIARLQAAGINATSVQNPLTTLGCKPIHGLALAELHPVGGYGKAKQLESFG